MTTPRLMSVVSDRTDVELAAVFGRIWRARGYRTHVRFRGSDVHVDAVGKTPEGVRREIRIRMIPTGIVTADEASAFVRWCERVGIEPYMVAVGSGRVAPDAHRPGPVAPDASAIAVEIRETGVESFIRDLVAEGDGTSDGEGRGPSFEGNDDDAEGPEDDGTDENGAADWLTRREALTKAGTYVAGGFVIYLVVERVSDVIQQSSEPRAAVARRVTWFDAYPPDVRLPPVEWSVPTPQLLSEESTLPDRTTTASTLANAMTIPYVDLRERPETHTGTIVTYVGRVEETTEHDEVRLVLAVVKDDRGRLSGDVVARWPTGRSLNGDIGFRLLADEHVQPWGVVAGEGSISGGVQYPHIDVSVLEKT